MFRMLATGFLTRGLARGVNRISPNPIVRAAGVAAAGLLAARLLRPRRGAHFTRRRRGMFGRVM